MHDPDICVQNTAEQRMRLKSFVSWKYAVQIIMSADNGQVSGLALRILSWMSHELARGLSLPCCLGETQKHAAKLLACTNSF